MSQRSLVLRALKGHAQMTAEAFEKKLCWLKLNAKVCENGQPEDNQLSDRCWEGLQAKHHIKTHPFSGCLRLGLLLSPSDPSCPV